MFKIAFFILILRNKLDRFDFKKHHRAEGLRVNAMI